MYIEDDKKAERLGYHHHNFFCDGKEKLDKYIQEAVKQGFKGFGFSSHAPFLFYNKWSISSDNLNKYIQEIEKLTNQYAGKIRIFKSLEIDYLPEKIQSFDFFKTTYNLDYTIGSIHYVTVPNSDEHLFIDGPRDRFMEKLQAVFNGDYKHAVQCYFEQTMQMIETQRPDIVGHIDKISMNMQEFLSAKAYPLWYKDLLWDTLKCAKNKGSLVELNLRGLIKGKWHTSFIDEQFLPWCRDLKLPMVVSTDAHHPQEVAKMYDYGIHLLKSNGIRSIYGFDGLQWKEYKI
jgi:histidinol-phosphatase (PHP family)